MKYLDADVLIYWATDHPKHGETATKIVKHVELNLGACAERGQDHPTRRSRADRSSQWHG